jgi:hypothetical protein
MPTIVIVLALIGVVGIVAGAVALRTNWVRSQVGQTTTFRRWWPWIALLLGTLLGIASWPLTYWMGYTIQIEAQPGRIVGFPFFVAYFDSEGRDYVGSLTLPGVIANCIFWFFIPQLALRFFNRRRPVQNARTSA